MKIFLWILQIILAVKLLTTAITHGVQHRKPSMQAAIQKMGGAVRTLLVFTAAASLIGALGLVLPGLFGLPEGVITASAGFSAVMLGLSLLCHRRSREKPALYADVILLVFALVIALGRGLPLP